MNIPIQHIKTQSLERWNSMPSVTQLVWCREPIGKQMWFQPGPLFFFFFFFRIFVFISVLIILFCWINRLVFVMVTQVLLVFLINFYWRIVALQCCVSFYCTAKWISHTYTYMPSLLDFLPIQVTTEHWVEFPVLYSRFSLVIYFIHSINSVYVSIPISQFLPPSHLPLGIHTFVLYVSLFLLCK